MPEDSRIYAKYRVERSDGRDRPGKKHEGCITFVLDVNHDPAARPALEAFAEACKQDRPALSEAVTDMLMRIAPVQT